MSLPPLKEGEKRKEEEQKQRKKKVDNLIHIINVPPYSLQVTTVIITLFSSPKFSAHSHYYLVEVSPQISSPLHCLPEISGNTIEITP